LGWKQHPYSLGLLASHYATPTQDTFPGVPNDGRAGIINGKIPNIAIKPDFPYAKALSHALELAVQVALTSIALQGVVSQDKL